MKKAVIVVLSVLLLGAVASAAAWFFPILTVSTVEVTGAVHADETAVKEASGVTTGSNMLRVDTAAAASGISHVPWVDKVTVSRTWPRTITITIEEHVAAGFVKKGSTPLAVNTQGAIFLSGLQPEGVPEFERTKSDDAAAIHAAATAVSALPQELKDSLERVEAPDADSIAMFFPEGREVFWGSADRAEEKAEATRIVLGKEGTRWNVSNPSMTTVRDYSPPPAP
ncbi:FtsQ-type POTRA domain-containing protein [Corynebacterium sp. zg254]|uniref:FtsQ-type POTRA domain-containing protein n=1 Tax=Corynebacterium zhongnanshanii TaxID=2768834 RepID=A0ABQ6VD18_9CORY|nr:MULTISPECIES: FtsQ-type POTRA domain-containing protein [Corynebacterium]KAB3520815.1 FtsQ-type POTRA domain-containing protein [Corynebacterium zhongnanshanii]MCR5914433.1 FtsQ-type POTRA domain-containing protein [Corynebacterium sp. zg254]